MIWTEVSVHGAARQGMIRFLGLKIINGGGSSAGPLSANGCNLTVLEFTSDFKGSTRAKRHPTWHLMLNVMLRNSTLKSFPISESLQPCADMCRGSLAGLSPTSLPNQCSPSIAATSFAVPSSRSALTTKRRGEVLRSRS